MANCLLNKSLLKANTCGYVLNEVKDVYLCNYSDVVSSDTTYNCESGVTLTDFTLATGASFSHIEVAKNSVTYTDELVVEDSTGAKYRTHTLTFGLNGAYDKDMVCSVDALSLGRFFAIIKTAGGQYLAMGRTAGLEASEQAISGGENNGITVTLTANVAESAMPLSDAAVTKLLANLY